MRRCTRTGACSSEIQLLRIDRAPSPEVHVACRVAPPQVARQGPGHRPDVEGDDHALGLLLGAIAAQVGGRRGDRCHVAQPGWKEDQVAGPRRVEEAAPEGRAVTPGVAQAQLSGRGARLCVEDADVVFPHVRVRPVEFAGAVHRRPIEDAVVEPVRNISGHARADQVPAAKAVDDPAEPLVLRQGVELGPSRIGIRRRRIRRPILLCQ
mmetsp:Transcript_88114/g.189159  ORF Transcript_88114/g.189159 Transcript_88114/m.189159 type:complete len:209 (+) Transcript_88114:73-699(+)